MKGLTKFKESWRNKKSVDIEYFYIWQSENFPEFIYENHKIIPIIEQFAHNLGELNGIRMCFSEETKLNTFAEIMLPETIKTSEIEGEYFNHEDVMSSSLKPI